MTEKVRRLLALIEHYRFERFYPQLVYVVWDAREGRLSEADVDFYLAFLEARAAEFERVPWHLIEWPTEDELYVNGAPEVRLGYVRDHPELVFGLCPSRGVQHLLVQGRSGSGKSGLLRRFLKAMRAWARQHGVRLVFFVFDLKGGDFQVFALELGPDCLHLNADETLRVGFNGPASVPLHVWHAHLGECLRARLDLQFSEATILGAIEWLQPFFNPRPTTRRLYPGPRTLLRLLKTAHPTFFSTKAPYTESAQQALDRLIRVSGPLFHTSHGLDLTELLAAGKSCVIQMPNLDYRVACLVVDLLLGQLLLDRRTRQIKTNQVHAVICIDECDQLVAHATAAAGLADQTPVLPMLAKQGRELGLQLALGASHVVGMSRLIVENLHTLILLRQTSPEGLQVAARLLAQPGGDALLGALEPGQCLFRLAEGWTHTTAGMIDFVPPYEGADAPVYDTHPYEPERSLEEVPEIERALIEGSKQQQAVKLHAARQHRAGLSEQARNLLDAWALEPCAPLHYLFKRIRCLSDGRQAQVHRELELHKLAEVPHPPPRIGKTRVGVMWITDEGWRWLHRSPLKVPGRGGIVHIHAATWIRTVGQRAGHETFIEWTAPGTNHPVDVAWRVGERSRAFEICVDCEGNLPGHIQACLVDSDAVESVTVVALQKREPIALRAAVEEAFPLSPILARVHYETLEHYYRKLYPA